jgi:hypothetical protein
MTAEERVAQAKSCFAKLSGRSDTRGRVLLAGWQRRLAQLEREVALGKPAASKTEARPLHPWEQSRRDQQAGFDRACREAVPPSPRSRSFNVVGT